MKTPTVSVCMIAYNHEEFIEEAINGVLLQDATYYIELIICDDCSTDKTQEVVSAMIESTYKGISLKYIRHQENIGMMRNLEFALKNCSGNYIAFCEGDDYWTDSKKIQKQVDFLENNKNFVLSFHNTIILNQDTKNEKLFIEKYNKLNYDAIDVLSTWYIPTASMVFRNVINILPEYMIAAPHGDLGLQLYLSKFGKFRLLDEVMAVYRKNENGISNSYNTLKYYKAYILQMESMNVYFKNIYNNELKSNIFDAYNQIIRKKVYENNIQQLHYFSKILTLNALIDNKKRANIYLTLKSLILNLLFGQNRT